MIIDCIGCLHGAQPKLSGGDLLIVTGDLTSRDTHDQHIEFSEWINKQNYKKIVIIAGNHDNYLKEKKPWASDVFTSEYLCDSGTEFEGLKIWGSPWSSQFDGMNPHCKAFTEKSDELLIDKWDLIPLETDILITHSPPFGILDGILTEDGSLHHVGSKSLRKCLRDRIRPKLHIFSHIHEGHGKSGRSVNCSIMNEFYEPIHEPIRITL